MHPTLVTVQTLLDMKTKENEDLQEQLNVDYKLIADLREQIDLNSGDQLDAMQNRIEELKSANFNLDKTNSALVGEIEHLKRCAEYTDTFGMRLEEIKEICDR